MKASKLTTDDMRDELLDGFKQNLDDLDDEEVAEAFEEMHRPYQHVSESRRQQIINALMEAFDEELDEADEEELLERLEVMDEYGADILREELAEEEAA
jgi:hypothetical protein